MGETKPRARSEVTATARALGMLSALAFGVLAWRRSTRRRRAEARPASRGPRDLVEESLNLLGAIRGYCELAKIKGESGGALESRMDSSIETVDEAAALLRQVLAACRRQTR